MSKSPGKGSGSGSAGKGPNRRVPARASKVGKAVSKVNGKGLKSLDFDFISDYSRMREVQEQIIAAVVANGFAEDDLFAIKLCVEEALINAIKHGNKLDLSKHVHVRGSVSPARFEITIRDEGAGFERGEVPDPTDPSNWEKPSGRGLLLMESYMTQTKYSDHGRQILMVKEKSKSA